MDQVKDIVRLLYIQRFWVLSGVVTIIGVVFWYLASSELAEQTATQTQKLNAAFGTAQQVNTIKLHANEHSEKRMEEASAKTRRSVAAAWRKQYESQEHVLVWPKRLEEDFARAVQGMRPVESIPFPTPLDKEISVQLRTRYRDYIQEVLPRLAEPIRAEWSVFRPGMAPANPQQEGRDGRPALPNPDDDKYIVHWDSKNQTQIAARFDWSKQAESVPKTLQILYAQEDFWVLQSLMSIIAATNGEVDARYKAAIKNIETIDLGADLARVSGQITRVNTGAPGQPAPGPQPMAGAPNAEANRGIPAPAGVPGAEGTAVDPADFRYVDNNLAPLSAARLRQALVSQTKEEAVLAVAKRMPVRLRLLMDIRMVNKLITECGNATLPLEVRQVRLNRGTIAAQGGNVGLPGLRQPQPKIPGMQGPEGNRGLNVDPYLTPVEIFGIVYLYNPPVRTLMGNPGVGPNGEPLPPAGATAAVGFPNTNARPN